VAPQSNSCASKTPGLEENEGAPFLMGLLGLASGQVGLMSNGTSVCVEMCLIRGKKEGYFFLIHIKNFDFFQGVPKYCKNCRSHYFFSSILILFTVLVP